MDTSNGGPIIHDFSLRLDALERQNERLALENRELHDELTTLRTTLTSLTLSPLPDLPDLPTSEPRHEPPTEPMSRRRFLSRATQAAAAAAIAGTLVHHDAHASAAGTTVDGEFDTVYAYRAVIDTTTNLDAVQANNHGDGTGVFGGSGSGVGVAGLGAVGVAGYSATPGSEGVYGEHYGAAGDGVVGQGVGPTGVGAVGRNAAGIGVRGEGKTGVSGVSPNGNGVYGEGAGAGYGGVFKSRRAQIRLAPTGRIGKPKSGAHQIGELYLDKTGSLFICTAAGTPGTWRKVSTTTA